MDYYTYNLLDVNGDVMNDNLLTYEGAVALHKELTDEGEEVTIINTAEDEV